ncbi:putative aaa family [Diplodia seriata]|uniref:Putative aaa family n=1 Tax=Diplodia seriata TaxID=420778 RepID=A0A0G2GE30_9PEZI|nr:putative aaa family [Diplodia seriata]
MNGQQSTIKTLYEGEQKCQCCINWVETPPEDLSPEIEQLAESKKHALLVRMKKSHDSERKPLVLDSIVVQSSHLKELLGRVFRDYVGITTDLERLVFKAPFKPFFYEWDNLRETVQQEQDPLTKEHGRLLRKLLHAELRDAIALSKDHARHKVIDFANLWTIFRPGIDVLSANEGNDSIYRLIGSSTVYSGDNVSYQLELHSIDYDGSGFGYRLYNVQIAYFEGTAPVISLEAYPADLHPSICELRQRLHMRGERFRDLQAHGFHYRSYEGMADIPMQDHIATSMNRPPPPGNVKSKDISDDLLYLCAPKVRGFSFKVKKWATFFVDQIQEVKWNENAFDKLVLPSDHKRLMLSFVESQIRNKKRFDDVIEGKGQGIVILLEGSPGVGKTLTAEALADRLRKPLYAMSIAELGKSAPELEARLTMILEVAVKWDAVVLLDEADVFLEKRRSTGGSTDNLERNGIVAIFLRLLEYFRGVLFMTTNRVRAMDPAFQSRIHLNMAYPDLDVSARRAIWESMIAMVDARGEETAIGGDELDGLARCDLNGREIKNLVKSALLLATYEGVPLGVGHVETVLRVTQKGVVSGDQASASE